MFERFTREARNVVTQAQVEARALGHDYVGSEHLLLGVIAAERGTAPEVLREAGMTVESTRTLVTEVVAAASFSGTPDPEALATIGVDLEEVRRNVEDAFGPGALESTKAARARVQGRRGARGHLRFTPPAKASLEFALREALALGHRHIGAEHILLGLLRNTGARASDVLAAAGADPKLIRESVISRIAA